MVARAAGIDHAPLLAPKRTAKNGPMALPEGRLLYVDQSADIKKQAVVQGTRPRGYPPSYGGERCARAPLSGW